MIARRQAAILRAFPDALDLLLICVQSGMSVEAALGRVAKDIACQSIELAEELSLTMAELAYLPLRWRAYHNLGERTGLSAVKLIAAALAQAERLGTSISHALMAAAAECRSARLNEAEQQAAALPPKLTVPLVVFFLPVLMAVILTPAVINMRTALRDNGGSFTQQTEPRRGAKTSPYGRAVPAKTEMPDRSVP
jgi:tight adherence protein C